MYSYVLSTVDFNPRSDERSDQFDRQLFGYLNHFNPRSDERSDLVQQELNILHNISIHAPTNGATISGTARSHTILISIHAPTNGATSGSITDYSNCKFQSTLRRTERQRTDFYTYRFKNFNPRSDERSDDVRYFPFDLYTLISIHAPTNGATL